MKLKIFSAALLIVSMAASSIAADDVYSTTPTFSSPYYAGKVKSQVLNDALEELNYIRGLVGVPNNITLNDSYTNKAQHGAVLLDVIDTLTHTPGKPSDMGNEFYQLGYDATTHGNLSAGKMYYSDGRTYGYMSLSQSLKGCMDDSDASNISRVGHRRWLMNPRLKQTGFGLSTRRGYAVTYVIEENDNLPSWPISDEFITWPTSKREHPLTYFDSQTAWSVTLNREIFNKSNTSSIRVILIRLSDNKTWNFSSSSSDGDFYDNQESYAYDECIIFRPDGVTYNNGERWRVSISGLNRRDGRTGNISYNVRFTSSSTGYEQDESITPNVIQRVESKDDDSGGCDVGFSFGAFALMILVIPRVRKRVGK